jgi:hypothetical protein
MNTNGHSGSLAEIQRLEGELAAAKEERINGLRWQASQLERELRDVHAEIEQLSGRASKPRHVRRSHEDVVQIVRGLADQNGLVTWKALHDGGLSNPTTYLYGLEHEGEVRRVGRGVYEVVGAK